MPKDFNNLPAVDEEFLAKCFGLESWPHWLPLNSRRRRLVARVITDALRPYPTTNKIAPDTALYNGEVWINDAYEWGKEEGIRLERQQWERKISELFGLKPTKSRDCDGL